MKRYFLQLSYQGTRYAGWQIQPNANSVQASITTALEMVLRHKIDLVGCGRTDAGVHARQYVAHFDSPSDLPDNLLYRLNRMLPHDIALHQLHRHLPDDAHARYSANYRAYEYYLHFDKNPFIADQSYHFSALPLDFELMQQAAQLLLNYQDFPMFCKTDSDAQHYLCHLYEAHWQWQSQQRALVFRIAANRFLRGMVRLIVGSLLMVGKHKISIDEYQHTLSARLPKFKYLNQSVPPQGLFLCDVRYPFELDG